MPFFLTSNSLSSTYFLLLVSFVWLSPKCFSDTLFSEEKILSWLIRTMVEFTVVSLVVEWGIMGKMGCISVTSKFLRNRWKVFCILSEFPRYKPVCIITILFRWSFLFKNEHWIMELPENLMNLNNEHQGQVLLESKISGTEESISPHWHICT